MIMEHRESQPRFIPHHRATLGEGPIWAADEQALYWIDIHQDRLIRYAPTPDRSEVRALPHRPTSLALLGNGRLLVSYKTGAGIVDFASGQHCDVEIHGVDFTREAFNDSACDSLGRLWIGTRDPAAAAAAAVGRLYRVDADLQATCVDDGFVISNGRAWSPDGCTLYHTDSVPGRIDAYDFDVVSGSLSQRRVFLDYRDSGCRPDGCTVDAEGGLWVAEVEGWRVARYLPTGELDRRIALPFRKPSSVAFGGPDLRTLFVTSVTAGLTDQERQDQAHAGMLTAIDVDTPGLAEHRFALNTD